MRRKTMLGARLLLVSVLAIAWFAPPAQAEVLSVSGPTDFWFEVPEPTTFQVRSYAIGNGIDSHLWLYDAAGNEIAANDDWFGLDSWLDIPLQPGSYRLRAGVCCGDPNRWYGTGYTIDINVSPIPPPTTPTEPPVTEPPTTEPPVTEPPATDPPITEPPVTEPPVTEPPVTDPPETTTEAPTTTIVVIPPPIQEEPVWVPTTESTPPTTTPITTAPETSAPVTTEASTETSMSSSPPSTEPAATNVVTQAPATAPIATPPAESVAPEQPPVVIPPEEITETTVATVSATTVPSFDTAPSADAPLEVRQAFENSVDLFSGEFDDYVPIGSTISVAQRRVVIAATAVMFLLPAPTSRRRI